MDFIIWVLIGLGVLFIITMVVVFYFLYKLQNKNKIRVSIIMKSGSRYIQKFKPSKIMENQITVLGFKYIFDDKCLIRGKWLHDIFYYEGNPEPIHFDFSQNIPKTQAKDLQAYLDTDLIEKLFNEKIFELMKLLLIIDLIATGICLIILIIIIAKMNPPVTIADSLENRALISEIVKQTITGVAS